jgi:TolB protein
MTRIALLVCAGLVAALVASTVIAHATSPGPDGRIAFTSDRSGTGNIFSIKPDGSGLQQLTFLTADQGGDGEPAWSPDGKLIVFTEHSPDFSTFRLWLMNADGSNRHQLFRETSDFNDFQGTFSPDGRYVIFRHCSNSREYCQVSRVKTDGTGLNALTHLVSSEGGVFDVHPEYSPDGNSVSFSSFNRGGVQNGVYVMGVHSGKLQLITPTGLEAVDADWSPDSSRLVFWGPCCVAQLATLWTAHPDGSGLKQLTNTGTSNDIRPSWAPGGDAVAFERDAADFSASDIYTMKPDGSGQTLLVSDGYYPSWGPAS